MHSPPPTPATVRRSTRTSERFATVDEDLAASGSRKRKRDFAGLITPRDTPDNKSRRGIVVTADETAKILFPHKKKRKFKVFEDPKTPEAFEDEASPFAPGAPKHEHLEHVGTTTLPEEGADGEHITYVFRGKKVVKKLPLDEDTTGIGPRRLFVKEMRAPKLSNPFEEDEDEDFDGLELSTYHASSTRRKLPST